MIRLQEVIHAVQPDVIVETGVAHGGALIFYASLCKAMDRGRVIGVDVEIRTHNREAIESHLLAPLITLIEGSSIEPRVVNEVKSQIKPNETVMVMLDANGRRLHPQVILDLMKEPKTSTGEAYRIKRALSLDQLPIDEDDFLLYP